MQQSTFKEKYPVWTLELLKEEVAQKSVPEILAYFKEKIEAHPIAVYIATFDHYSHTKGHGGAIAPEIKDMQNIIFCFGPEIPNTKVAAVRPRSIGVCELENSFVIEFMEAPAEKAHDTMEMWAKALRIA
ncbi:MAG TPA: hypothetical protein ENK93_03275 [Campylobacteraceae bacterium]|nr:hypothetical protein [Campylobacteraceae bacterium]HHD83878.1 hypothetical protein [Campylobacteraceae bacterium]